MSLATRSRSIVSLGLLLAFIALSYFVYSNLWPNYSSAKDSLTKAETDNTRLNAALASVQTFLSTYRNQQANVQLTDLALPAKSEDMANFTSSLGDLAAASGVSLSNLQVADLTATGHTAAENSIQAEDINLSASGSSASLKDFILRLESHLRLIDVYHVTAKSDETNGTGANLQYQVKMRTYYQK